MYHPRRDRGQLCAPTHSLFSVNEHRILRLQQIDNRQELIEWSAITTPQATLLNIGGNCPSQTDGQVGRMLIFYLGIAPGKRQIFRAALEQSVLQQPWIHQRLYWG